MRRMDDVTNRFINIRGWARPWAHADGAAAHHANPLACRPPFRWEMIHTNRGRPTPHRLFMESFNQRKKSSYHKHDSFIFAKIPANDTARRSLVSDEAAISIKR